MVLIRMLAIRSVNAFEGHEGAGSCEGFFRRWLPTAERRFVLTLCVAGVLALRRRREGVGFGGWLFIGSIAVPAAIVILMTVLGY